MFILAGHDVHQSHEAGPWWDRLRGRHRSTLWGWHCGADARLPRAMTGLWSSVGMKHLEKMAIFIGNIVINHGILGIPPKFSDTPFFEDGIWWNLNPFDFGWFRSTLGWFPGRFQVLGQRDNSGPIAISNPDSCWLLNFCLLRVQMIRFGRGPRGPRGPHRRTVYKLFTQYLDLFGKPSREFLKKLFPFAEA